jgi:hypothetical protein
MDGRTRRSARACLALVPLAAIGCANSSWWPIRPFGSVHTYDGTVFPSARDRPRGRMVGPPAPGFSIAAEPGSHDSETRRASTK